MNWFCFVLWEYFTSPPCEREDYMKNLCLYRNEIMWKKNFYYWRTVEFSDLRREFLLWCIWQMGWNLGMKSKYHDIWRKQQIIEEPQLETWNTAKDTEHIFINCFEFYRRRKNHSQTIYSDLAMKEPTLIDSNPATSIRISKRGPLVKQHHFCNTNFHYHTKIRNFKLLTWDLS